MTLTNKSRYRPLYKQFLKLRENVQNRKKLLKFKNAKWKHFIQDYKRKLRRYKKYKPQDQNRYIVSKYPNKGTSYQKRYRSTLNNSKKFRLFYGNLPKNAVKKQIKQTLKIKIVKQITETRQMYFLELFEQRLDTILYRSKFSISLRNARQLITHEKILVNKKLVKTPSYILKPGDIISVKNNSALVIDQNFKNVDTWPIPPKHLVINYKTMEIAIVGKIKSTNLATSFPFHLNLEKLLVNYSKN